MSTTSGRVTTTGFATGVLSLRGLLALQVATAHVLGLATFCNCGASVFGQSSVMGIALRIVSAIDVPVIFFVISGLAIARSLERKSAFGQGARTYFIFIVRRILRLYPAHTAATLGVLALAWLFLIDRPPIDFSGYPSLGFEFLPAWLNGKVFNPLRAQSVVANFAILTWSMNLVVWSLYVEVCAIPFLPLFYDICRRKNPVYDTLMLAGLTLLAVLFWDHMAVKFMYSFYLGMLVQTRGQAIARWLTRGRTAGRPAALAWLVMFATCLRPGDAPETEFTQTWCAFVLICLIVWRENQRSFRVLDHPALYWTGRMSYSFYLWHFFLMTLMFRPVFAALPAPAFVREQWLIFGGIEIASVAAALGLAQLSYSFIEEPFIRWGQRFETWGRGAEAPRWAGTLSPEPQPQAAD